MEIIVSNVDSGFHPDYSANDIAGFLYKHLDQFGDPIEDILKSVDYVMTPNRGGNIFLAVNEEKIKGACIVNNTGMSGYIPENILVYIAVDGSLRGQGIGQKIMNEVVKRSSGSIALHCEPDNPALKLYQKLGFTSKYLEMRLQK